MQVHVYLGLIAGGLFVLHAGAGLPSGVLQSLLWVCTVALLATGLAGLAVTRLAPRAITEHGEQLIFERIPRLRHELAEAVRVEVEASVAEGQATALADYYRDRLHADFNRPRHLVQHVLGSRARAAALPRGPLTPEHADVAGCAGCHEAGDAGPSGIARAAMDGVAPAHAGDSRACLTCHQVGEAPFAPHGAQSLPAAPAGDDPDAPQLSPPYILNEAGDQANPAIEAEMPEPLPSE